MAKKRIVDAMISTDEKTHQWKMRFACARMSYQAGNLREAERMLIRLQEPAQELPEHVFAENAIRIGLGAVQIAASRPREAKSNLEHAMSALEGSATIEKQELYATALRFHAELLIDKKDFRTAEQELKQAVQILEKIGEDALIHLAYAISDLAGLYALQGRLSEANQLIVRSMQILGDTVGTEDQEYARASMIYNISTATEAELLDIVNAAGITLQYQFGANHPSMLRALRRYVKALKERGETARLEEAKHTFAAFDQAMAAEK